MTQFVRFAMVGVIGFLVDAGLSNFLVWSCHTAPLIARLPAFVLATIVTYSANRSFTFNDRQTRFWVGWIKYVSSTSFGALLNYATFSFFVAYLVHGSLAVWNGVAAGSIVGLGCNYICATRFVFSPS